jgi:hypothetical protein
VKVLPVLFYGWSSIVLIFFRCQRSARRRLLREIAFCGEPAGAPRKAKPSAEINSGVKQSLFYINNLSEQGE